MSWHQRHRFQWNSATVQLRSNTGSDRYASIVMNRATRSPDREKPDCQRQCNVNTSESHSPFQQNHEILPTTSWSPVTVSTVGPCRMSPFQAHPSHCRNFKTGTCCHPYLAIHIRVVNRLLHNVLPVSYVTHKNVISLQSLLFIDSSRS